MGLESGWNCHISLLNDDNQTEISYGVSIGSHHYSSTTKGSKSSLIHESQPISKNCRSQSAPGSVNMEVSTVKFADDCDVESINSHNSESSFDSHNSEIFINMEDDDKKSSRYTSKDGLNMSTTPSRRTGSTGSENPFGFDMSNRAKLPKGIENIRPHLENVDNVPLLVSLFTDCSPDATKEMIEIMQEYGEVVCVIGSSANIHNMPIFLHADARFESFDIT